MTKDPRPLSTEPFPLDLVNTLWIDESGPHDLLEDPDATSRWLEHAGYPGAPTDQAARAALHQAREAIRACVPHSTDPTTREGLDTVLRHGHLHVRAGRAGPEEQLAVDEERWRVPWQAVRGLLALLDDQPERIRVCANAECVLAFHDVSRNGRRQWCSMDSCGNRAKARRHYARSRASE